MKKITGGIYLVVDPMPGLNAIFPKVKAALDGGVDVIQLWNHWNQKDDHKEFIISICNLAHEYDVPVIINENWQWLQELPLDGVHFDKVPENIHQIRKDINRSFLIGITCGNDDDPIQWAIENNLDYISFCSMFPSSTSNSCELVNPAIIQSTRERTSMPIYAAGGITFKNTPLILSLGINGVAIVSGIMKAEDPKLAAYQFKQCLVPKNQGSIL